MKVVIGVVVAGVLLVTAALFVSRDRREVSLERPTGESSAEVTRPGKLSEPKVVEQDEAPAETKRAALAADSNAGLARLKGTVSGRYAAGLEGARVEVSSFEREEGQPRFYYETRSGPGGEFGFELEIGREAAEGAGQTYLVHASHSDYEAATLVTPTLRAGFTVTRNLTLEPRTAWPVEVHVEVRDRAGPVLGADVLLFDRVELEEAERTFDERVDSATTNAHGDVLLGSNRIGDKLIVVQARGLGFQLYRHEFTVQRPGLTTHTAHLLRGLPLAGVVRSAEGELIGGLVMTLDPQAELEVEQVTLRSGAGGIFRAQGLAQGVHTLECLADGVRWSPFRIDVHAGQENLELVIKPPTDPLDHALHLGEIHGTIPSHDGSLIGMRIVKVETLDLEELARDVWPNLLETEPNLIRKVTVASTNALSARRLLFSEGGHLIQTSEAGASFHFTGLEDGDYCLVFSGPAGPGLAGPFPIRGGALFNGVRIELPVRPAEVSGRVLDLTGQPVEGALVVVAGRGDYTEARLQKVRDLGLAVNGIRSGNDGRFALQTVPTRLPFIVVVLHISGATARSEVLELEPGENTALELTLSESDR